MHTKWIKTFLVSIKTLGSCASLSTTKHVLHWILCQYLTFIWHFLGFDTLTYFAPCEYILLKVRYIRNVFLVTSLSSKKRTKTRRIVVKTNWFVRFLEEFTAWQFAFEINWSLGEPLIDSLHYIRCPFLLS